MRAQISSRISGWELVLLVSWRWGLREGEPSHELMEIILNFGGNKESEDLHTCCEVCETCEPLLYWRCGRDK